MLVSSHLLHRHLDLSGLEHTLRRKLAPVETSSTGRLHTLGGQVSWNIQANRSRYLTSKDPVLANWLIEDQLVDQEMAFTYLNKTILLIIRISKHSAKGVSRSPFFTHTHTLSLSLGSTSLAFTRISTPQDPQQLRDISKICTEHKARI